MTGRVNMIRDEYDKMAEDFLEKHNATITFELIGERVQPWADFDGGIVNVVNAYWFTIERDGMKYSGTFYTSYNDTRDGIEPTAYDVLACVQKYEVGTYHEFCEEYGYDIYYRESEEIYRRLLAEEIGIRRLFGDCMDELREIV